MDDRLRGAEVVHLSFSPAFARGSFNPLVGALLNHGDGPRQVAISYWDQPPPSSGAGLERTVLVDHTSTGAANAAALRLPERLRRRLLGDMASTERIRYALAAAALLDEARPPVVVVWDDYKLGSFLRPIVGDHCRLVLSQHGRSYHLAREAARELYRLESYDAVITLTRASYQADRERVYAYEPLVLVRPNGVDTVTFAPADDRRRSVAKARWGLPSDRPVVLALARLAPSKGVHLLLDSWPKVRERVPDVLLWVVGGGDGAYASQLTSTTRALDLADHVRFEGAVAWHDVPDCLAAADLYAFPSVQDEGHPLSLLEAMSSGLACVAADSPVVRELHGDAVELVNDPNVQDAFVDPVIRLLRDKRARAARGRAAREQVLDRFGLDGYVDDLGRFFARLARSTGGRRP